MKRTEPGEVFKSAEVLRNAIDNGVKKQIEIATELGYKKPNFISMMKTGVVKIPLDVAPSIAKAVGLDPIYFTNLVLADHHPELHAVLNENLTALNSKNENMLLEVVRDALKGRDAGPQTVKAKRELAKLAKSWVS